MPKYASLRCLKEFLAIALCGGLLSAPTLSHGQSTHTLTQTQTSQFNNAVFGCEACPAITSQNAPHPDTSAPIFAGDPRATLLPLAIANGLAPNNQFGNGVPDGSSGRPINLSTGVNIDETGLNLSFANSLAGTPDGSGGRTNVLSQSIDQIIPGADSSTAGLGDQQFSIHFQVTSLTDPDGHLVGAATGTAVQTLNGVQTTTRFTFDTANGLVPETPFPYLTPSAPTGTP